MNSEPMPGGNALSDVLSLQHADSLVTLCPQIGGAVAGFLWRGRPILRVSPADAIRDRLVRKLACYPLVPYSNRIGNAELVAGGRRHRLRANAPPESHALHGFGWQRAWSVHACDGQSAELRLLHRADEDWPFDCEAREIVRLQGDSLQLRLTLRNMGEAAMPAGLGFHPFFPLHDGSRLQADWKTMWAMGEDKLPTGETALPPQADFRQERPLDGWHVDHCFSGWNQRAVLVYPGYRVLLEASSECRHIVCYSPGDERRFIALEPVTHVNNAFALAERGTADTGMRMLAPGEAMEISLSILPRE